MKFGLLTNFMPQNSLISDFLLTFAVAKMRADPRPSGADIESQSVIRHGDEHPAWKGASVRVL